MNILILGSGGREHALAWAFKQNPKCDRLIVAPGNAGIAQLAECADLDILDGAAVVTFCEENAIDFVMIGPEAGRDTRPTSPRTRTSPNSPSITRFTAPDSSDTVYSGALPGGAISGWSSNISDMQGYLANFLPKP